MRWAVVLAGSTPPDLEHILAAAHCNREPTPATANAFNVLLADPATEGLVVIGGDIDLAAVVARMRLATRDVPVALIPVGNSDLLRMFGLDRSSIVARLQTGNLYRVDLGYAKSATGVTPFVSHVVASPSGRLWHPGRSGPVTISAMGHSHRQSSWLVVVSNVQHLSSRTAAPKTSVGDGKFDVQVFGGSLTAPMRIWRLMRGGFHFRNPAVWRRSTPTASLSLPDTWQIRADGYPLSSGPIEISIEPAAFDL